MTNGELLHVSGSSYAWSGKYAVGVYLHEETKKAILFDSGPNNRTAEMLDVQINNQGYTIAAIIHTHGHILNTGGTSYFREYYPELQCYASHLSAPYIDYPGFLAPIIPISPTRKLDISELPESSDSASIITGTIPFRDGVFEINGIPLTIYTLPGHFPGMIGIETPDQVLYCADALFGASTLSQQKLLFFTEPKEAMQSLEKLKSLQAKHYVLYHGGIYNDISKIIKENVARLEGAYNDVLTLIEQQWHTLESITQHIMSKYDLENKEKQYYLAYTITLSYVRLLLNEGKVSQKIKNGLLFFKSNT
ncbi:MBL fold metallo-hydrolase [Paenibacillus thiaminolyticus]|uniref:MBL fold metallo-hydrolase n=1 Tax=Paenibacillus thiaminolyticus TaxID=49283 RepID=UPI00232CA2C6|nr:MBL fold metallo-hydrolase [Paenibacillus thiaminolyticus]WCF05646.1 MBL fold metallo-hydrolase [Paenibacillus thiaminolyticus]